MHKETQPYLDARVKAKETLINSCVNSVCSQSFMKVTW